MPGLHVIPQRRRVGTPKNSRGNWQNLLRKFAYFALQSLGPGARTALARTAFQTRTNVHRVSESVDQRSQAPTHTFRKNKTGRAAPSRAVLYGRIVGGALHGCVRRGRNWTNDNDARRETLPGSGAALVPHIGRRVWRPQVNREQVAHRARGKATLQEDRDLGQHLPGSYKEDSLAIASPARLCAAAVRYLEFGLSVWERGNVHLRKPMLVFIGGVCYQLAIGGNLSVHPVCGANQEWLGRTPSACSNISSQLPLVLPLFLPSTVFW